MSNAANPFPDIEEQPAPTPRTAPRTLPSIALLTCDPHQSRHLEATIRSVLLQNFARLEYGIVGKGDDVALAIIRRYASHLTNWTSMPAATAAAALADGFARTSGEVMGWVAAGDLLLPGALHAIAEFFSERPTALAVCGDAVWVDVDGNVVRERRTAPIARGLLLHARNYVPQPSMFWRRSLYDAVGGIDAGSTMSPACELWLRFARACRIERLHRFLSAQRLSARLRPSELRVRHAQESDLARTRAANRVERALHSVIQPGAHAMLGVLELYSQRSHRTPSHGCANWFRDTVHHAAEDRDDFGRILAI